MSRKSRTQSVSSQNKRSRKEHDSDEEMDDDPCSEFVLQKADMIKDCLLYLMAHNSTLLPVKRNDIFCKFGDKLSIKEKNAAIHVLKERLLTVGACLKAVDSNRFIIVNNFPKNSFSMDVITPERQLLQLVLCLIAVNRGTIMKNELFNLLDKLGITLTPSDVYFGDVNKSLLLFEKQCYLKKTLNDKDNITYEWGIRANCEVDKNAFMKLFVSQMNSVNIPLSLANLTITPPEDDLNASSVK